MLVSADAVQVAAKGVSADGSSSGCGRRQRAVDATKETALGALAGWRGLSALASIGAAPTVFAFAVPLAIALANVVVFARGPSRWASIEQKGPSFVAANWLEFGFAVASQA